MQISGEIGNIIEGWDFMLKWYKNLYLGNTVRGQERKLIRRLEKGKPVPGVWLVTIASNEENNLDLIPSELLLQKALRVQCPMIVGIGFTRLEALLVLARIVQEVYQETKDMNIRAWLLERADGGKI